jgi:hypothetical protein
MHAAGVHATTIQPEFMDPVAHKEFGTKWCSEPICDDNMAACREGACCPPADSPLRHGAHGPHAAVPIL